MFPPYMLFPDARNTIRRLGESPSCRPAKQLSNGVACRVVKAARRRSRSRARENSSSASRWLVLPSIVPFRVIGRVRRAPAARLELSVLSAPPFAEVVRARATGILYRIIVHNITSSIFLRYSLQPTRNLIE
jgi:hypothetical protein